MTYWVGSKNKTDGPFWVYDPLAVHPDPEKIYLYSVFSNRMTDHEKFQVKREFNTVTGQRAAWALEQYEAWRDDAGTTFLKDDQPRAVREYATRMEQLREKSIELHKDHLGRSRKLYSGVSFVSSQSIREANCWSCTRELDSRLEIQCNSCKWMICSCGACGCTYPGHSDSE